MERFPSLRLWLLASVAAGGAFLLAWQVFTSRAKPVVVAYVSEDQVFSQPILQDFQRETGLQVRAVYDTEEAKSTGVMNRLIAEKDNPRADVYWANEPVRAEILKQRGISEAYASPNAADIPDQFKDTQGFWTGFSARARIFVVSKRASEKPKSVVDYADTRWKDKAVIANPLFGTTTVHMAALFVLWGDERAKSFLQSMKDNGVQLATSNGESADFVAAGEFDFGLVDSDDGADRLRQGKPIEIVYPDQGADEMGCLIVPNAVVLIKGAPHPDLGRKLADYLLSRETEKKLAFANCAQIPLRPGVPTPDNMKTLRDIKIMKVSYAQIAKKMQEIHSFLKEWAGY